jgi:hypothetical protein
MSWTDENHSALFCLGHFGAILAIYPASYALHSYIIELCARIG